MKPWAVVLTVPLVVGSLALSGCGGGATATPLPTATDLPTPGATPTSSDLVGAASTAYEDAFNTMVVAEAKAIKLQNSSNPTTSTNGIDARILARRAFDGEVSQITFPADAEDHADAVLRADAKLETDLSTLAADTGSTNSYDSELTVVDSAESAFQAADTALIGDLDLVDVTPTASPAS